MTITAFFLRPPTGKEILNKEKVTGRDQLLSVEIPSPTPKSSNLDTTSDAVDAVHVAQDALALRAPANSPVDKPESAFRAYTTATDAVKSFYRMQHTRQTLEFNLLRRQQFYSPDRPRPLLSVWDAMEHLNTLVDTSDPDTNLSQIEHLLQTAEAMRLANKPRWMQLTGLIHDLGKLMAVFPEMGLCQPVSEGKEQEQWDIVGDTFPVGCAFCPLTNILPESFKENPDSSHPVYSTKFGIYSHNCGLDNIIFSWGHDEYLYHVLTDPVNECLLPREALAMVRYHSFYPWHREGGYMYLMGPGDDDLLRAVREFNPFDLYSKTDGKVEVEILKPYYLDLIDEFFPKRELLW